MCYVHILYVYVCLAEGNTPSQCCILGIHKGEPASPTAVAEQWPGGHRLQRLRMTATYTFIITTISSADTVLKTN